MRIAVAIDGPAGAGKSTIAKLVGKKFDLMYINTGAMYRAVALTAKKKNIDKSNVSRLLEEIDCMEMHFENDDLILNGINIQDQITLPEISAITSDFASIKEVRQKLVALQRKISDKFDVIMDGRDIGTVVLKNAPFKFFLTASSVERATRRMNELISRGIVVNYEELLNDIEKRDYADMNREIDPLCKAEDATLIDTSNLNIEEVTNIICNLIQNKIK